MKPLIAKEEHQRVLEHCFDIPEQRPDFPIPLTEVGISGKTVWVNLPQGKIPFDVEMEVGLSGRTRGIHMSRMEEVIARLHDREFVDIFAYGEALCREMVALQHAGNGSVLLVGQLPVTRTGVASGRNSVDSIEIQAEIQVELEDNEEQIQGMLGVAVQHITACPCTQAYNQILFAEDAWPSACPQPTHSQRSRTLLCMGRSNGRPGHLDLLACLEEALHVTQDLLKRPDEAELVLKSHFLPQFAEDAVRATARCAGQRFGKDLDHETSVFIESLSLESIHIHDVTCKLSTTLGEIVALL